jgi:hypothetical protein
MRIRNSNCMNKQSDSILNSKEFRKEIRFDSKKESNLILVYKEIKLKRED